MWLVKVVDVLHSSPIQYKKLSMFVCCFKDSNNLLYCYHQLNQH